MKAVSGGVKAPSIGVSVLFVVIAAIAVVVGGAGEISDVLQDVTFRYIAGLSVVTVVWRLWQEFRSSVIRVWDEYIEEGKTRGIGVDDLREDTADLCHRQWSGWMIYMFGRCSMLKDGSVVIPSEFTGRWQRQMRTDYSELSWEEKESDRREADKFLSLILGDKLNDSKMSRGVLRAVVQ